jgi:hypothetical protein
MWSPIDSLVKTNHQYKIHSHPYELRTMKRSSALSWCGWLASSFDQCLHERTICDNTTWIVMTSSLLGVACFSCSILLIASTKHLKCSSDHHLYVSLPSTTLGLPTHWVASPYTREKWPLFKEPFLTLTWNEFDWLIQVMGLTRCVTLTPY